MTRYGRDESEWLTRKLSIDPKLKSWGWTVIPFDSATLADQRGCYAIAEYPSANGPADYALVVNGRVLGIVEAKKLTLGPQGVLTQAERYARGLPVGLFDFRGLRAPFLYSTNGEIIWFHDVRHPFSRSRKVSAFHTPAALQELLSRDLDVSVSSLTSNTEWHPRLRPYQIEANQAIDEAIAERKRLMLLAMATGTGKTFTMVNQMYRLMKSGAGRRILFLVDRRALAAQAVRAFAAFEPEPGLKFDQVYEVYSQRFHREDFGDEEKFDPKVLPASYLTDPKPGHAFVYVSTIQRMTINLFGRQVAFGLGDEELDEDAERLDIPIHAFDIVIADECHRGYSSGEVSVWRDTLEHFDAIKIGLTATPAAHTKAYFKEVVFRYEYERAVREGYLVDYDAVKIKSNVRMKGIFLNEGEQVGIIDTRSGAEKMDALEDERQFPSADIEQAITSPDSNRKIIEELKKYADEHEGRYGRQPKCLIFATNDLPHTSHADQLVDICRDVFGRGESFVQKITGRVERPLQRIREFRNRPNPGIAVTVDMLSTGVDIPDLEFIVLLRPIKSRILFEQMLGRGTRKGEKIPDKSHFTVFDCFDGTLLEYFRQATSITADPPDRPARTIVEVIEDIWANRDRPYNIRCLVKRLQRTRRCPPRPAGSSPGSFLTAISPATPRACLLHWTTTSPTR
jgi:type I restriction enzyme, R subunit